MESLGAITKSGRYVLAVERGINDLEWVHLNLSLRAGVGVDTKNLRGLLGYIYETLALDDGESTLSGRLLGLMTELEDQDRTNEQEAEEKQQWATR